MNLVAQTNLILNDGLQYAAVFHHFRCDWVMKFGFVWKNDFHSMITTVRDIINTNSAFQVKHFSAGYKTKEIIRSRD